MDGDPTASLAMLRAESAGPVHDGFDLAGPCPTGNGDGEADEGVPSGCPLAVPRPPPADRNLDLDHRLEPVDIRSLE